MTSWLLVIAASAALLFAGLLWRALHDAKRLRQRVTAAAGELESLQRAFSRFAPDEVIERIIAEGVVDFGEKKEVSVLFADVAGFTALSESLEPNVLVGILNGYFERMSQAISEHRGYVSTFIGDGLLAFFGATDPNPWQGDDCVRAALAMRVALQEYNDELAQRGLPTLAIGIGLHRGTGVVGLVGSRELKEFAFVGRAVNIAARVQELTRQYEVEIILTDRLKQTIDPSFAVESLPDTAVKGVGKPLLIHTLV
jgi:class 3 adenylate cyclase